MVEVGFGEDRRRPNKWFAETREDWKVLRRSGKLLVTFALSAFALTIALSGAVFAFGLGFAPGLDGLAWRVIVRAALVVGPMSIAALFMVAAFRREAANQRDVSGPRANWIGKGQFVAILITEGAVVASYTLSAWRSQGKVDMQYTAIQMGTICGIMFIRSIVLGRKAAKSGSLPDLKHGLMDSLWAMFGIIGLIGGAFLVVYTWNNPREGTFTSSVSLLGTGIDVVGGILMALITKFAQFGFRAFRLEGWRDAGGNILRITLKSGGQMALVALGAGYLSFSLGLWGGEIFVHRWLAYKGTLMLEQAKSVFLLSIKEIIGSYLSTYLALLIMGGTKRKEIAKSL